MLNSTDSLHSHEVRNPLQSGVLQRKLLDGEPLHSREVKAAVHANEVEQRSRYISAEVNRQVVIKNGGGGCEFVSAVTGERCGTHFQLQRDHVVPFSHGGSSRAENLRMYCAQHNRLRWQTRSMPRQNSEAGFNPVYGDC